MPETEKNCSFQRGIKILFFVVFASVLLLGGGLRFYDLNRQCLWQDEIHTVVYVNDHPSLWEVVHRVAVRDLHSPLYYILLRMEVWAGQQGDIPLTAGRLRLLSAFLGFLALGAMFLLMLKIFGQPGYALLGLFIAAISIYGIYYSQELRMYSLILCLAPMVLFFQLKLWDDPDAGLNQYAAAGYVISSVLMLYSSLICLFFIAGSLLSLLIMSWWERKTFPTRYIEVIKLGVLIILCYLPWIVAMWRKSMALKGGVVTGLIISNPRELFKFAFENLLLHSWKEGAGFGILSKIIRNLAPFSLLNLLERDKRRKHGMILLSFLCAFTIYFAITYNRAFHTGRYFSPWWPFAVYFVVAGFSGIMLLLRRIKPGLRWWGIGFLAGFLGLYIYVQGQQIRFYYRDFEKENWRQIVKYLNTEKQEGDVLLAAGGWHKACFTYYRVELPFITGQELLSNKIPGKYKRLIYINNEPPQKEIKGLTQKFEEQSFVIKGKKLFVWEIDGKIGD
ncbi:hypothetical protein KAR10_03970 [bacterium]|nr:hypothetical protein [bacterium]